LAKQLIKVEHPPVPKVDHCADATIKSKNGMCFTNMFLGYFSKSLLFIFMHMVVLGYCVRRLIAIFSLLQRRYDVHETLPVFSILRCLSLLCPQEDLSGYIFWADAGVLRRIEHRGLVCSIFRSALGMGGGGIASLD
jgi:hypothetical protein